MTEQNLYPELATTGSSAWSRLQRDVTSQLTCAVRMPDRRATRRSGMDTAEQLGRAFDLDVTDDAFWTASLDVVRVRIADYGRLAKAT